MWLMMNRTVGPNQIELVDENNGGKTVGIVVQTNRGWTAMLFGRHIETVDSTNFGAVKKLNNLLLP